MSVQVVTVCSRIPEEPYYYYREFLASLKRFGVEPTVLGMNEEWRGLMTKPWRLREWLRAGKNTSDRLIVCDAFDIVFAAEPEMIDAKCQNLVDGDVLFNAEKGCWPRGDLAEHFPVTVSPWRYLNSGFMCGPADKILAILEAMDIEKVGFDPVGGPYPNDQGEYQVLYTKQPVPMRVDYGCFVAQCLSGCLPEEFDLNGERIRNLVTNTLPGVFHFNGDAKNKLMPTFLKKLGLA